MAGDNFGSGFDEGFGNMSRSLTNMYRAKTSQQRADTYAQSAANRVPLEQAQAARIMAQIAEMPADLALRQQQAANGSLRDQLMQMNYELNLAKFKLQQQQDLDPNSTKNQSLALRQKTAGLAEPAQMPNGTTGTVVFPTKTEMTQQQQIINAAPQMDALLKQIQDGANSFINKPGEFKKYTAALNAAWTGSVTPAQEKILEQAGISQNAITQATETESRLLNVPKVESVFNLTNQLFKPHEGETLQSYNARIDALERGNATRYYQAMFNTTFGFPAGTDGVAQEAQNEYVQQALSNDPSLNGSLTDNSQKTNNSSSDIDQLANQYGITPEKMASSIQSLVSQGYTESQAIDYLKKKAS